MELDYGLENLATASASGMTDTSFDFAEDLNPASCSFSVKNGREDVHKFHILDETEDSDTEKSFSCDSDIPDDEIDKMLEDALEKRKRKADNAGLGKEFLYFSTFIRMTQFTDCDNEKQPFEEKDKVVLIEKSQNHFDVLPEGWIQVTHNSGMPLYLHKNSRVCTLAKPYFLGPGSVRVSYM